MMTNVSDLAGAADKVRAAMTTLAQEFHATDDLVIGQNLNSAYELLDQAKKQLHDVIELIKNDQRKSTDYSS